MKRDKNPRIKVVYQKLGRERVWGHADQYPLPIDVRARGKKHLEILIHECEHYLQPLLSEEEVTRIAVRLAKTLWYEGYRRIDNDEKEPLQDGSK